MQAKEVSTNIYRWINNGKTVQQKWLIVAGLPYYGGKRGQYDIPEAHLNEERPYTVWTPVNEEWRGVEETKYFDMRDLKREVVSTITP